jgi:hypothetical protein
VAIGAGEMVQQTKSETSNALVHKIKINREKVLAALNTSCQD